VTLLRRHWLGVGALVLIALATLLVLFAFDARAWQSSVRRDDMRFRALPDHGELWKPSTILPGDPAGAVLNTGDTISWRRALQSFWYTHVGTNPKSSEDLPKLRALTQAKLVTLMSSAKTSGERSAAANLLGVLTITTPVSSSNTDAVPLILKQSISFFQQAIALDPSDTAAKQNLELVLRVTRPGKGPIGRHAHAAFGFGRGHGLTVVGNGY
jgi:hypothetical protein